MAHGGAELGRGIWLAPVRIRGRAYERENQTYNWIAKVGKPSLVPGHTLRAKRGGRYTYTFAVLCVLLSQRRSYVVLGMATSYRPSTQLCSLSVPRKDRCWRLKIPGYSVRSHGCGKLQKRITERIFMQFH